MPGTLFSAFDVFLFQFFGHREAIQVWFDGFDVVTAISYV